MKAATCDGSISDLNTWRIAARLCSTLTPCSGTGAGTWKIDPGNGPKPILYGATLPVSAIPMNVRPWKAPERLMIPGRPVAERAIFTAFSTASAPVVKNAVFFACVPGVSALIRSASATYDSYGTI